MSVEIYRVCFSLSGSISDFSKLFIYKKNNDWENPTEKAHSIVNKSISNHYVNNSSVSYKIKEVSKIKSINEDQQTLNIASIH